MTKRFAMIPASAVFDKDLSRTTLAVLCALATYADKDGKCWPAVTTLAQRLNITTRGARKCISILRERGYIKTTLRQGHTSLYKIAIDPGTTGTGVGPHPGTRGTGGEERGGPGTPERGGPPNTTKNNTTNNYAFAGKVIRLSADDYQTWEQSYRHLDLRAELQALDDWYSMKLTEAEKPKWFTRCSNALAKKNREAKDRQPLVHQEAADVIH